MGNSFGKNGYPDGENDGLAAKTNVSKSDKYPRTKYCPANATTSENPNLIKLAKFPTIEPKQMVKASLSYSNKQDKTDLGICVGSWNIRRGLISLAKKAIKTYCKKLPI